MHPVTCVLLSLLSYVLTCDNPHHAHNHVHITSPPSKINFTALLVPFDLPQVTLTQGSIEYEGQELNKQYIHMIDLDRLLYTTYVTAGIHPFLMQFIPIGLKTSAEPLGGWESPDHPLRGNFIGIFITALAKSYASTHDPDMKSRVCYFLTFYIDNCSAITLFNKSKNVKIQLVLDMCWHFLQRSLITWKR
jgi:hypothetical protein